MRLSASIERRVTLRGLVMIIMIDIPTEEGNNAVKCINIPRKGFSGVRLHGGLMYDDPRLSLSLLQLPHGFIDERDCMCCGEQDGRPMHERLGAAFY